jgi:hypothetical protein
MKETTMVIKPKGQKVLEFALDDYGLGQMVDSEQNHIISYQPFEVARHSLGIVASEHLNVGSKLTLISAIGPIELVVRKESPCELSGLRRYRAVPVDLDHDIERLFVRSGCYKRLALAQSRIQSARYEVKPAIELQAKTFGTPDYYKFETINISKSGTLVKNINYRAPFINNTILEIVLDVGFDGLVPKKVHCLGKVVRTLRDNKLLEPSTQEYGIKLFDFSESDFNLWKDALHEVERAA